MSLPSPINMTGSCAIYCMYLLQVPPTASATYCMHLLQVPPTASTTYCMYLLQVPSPTVSYRLGNVKFIRLFLSLYYVQEMLLIAHASYYM